MFISIDAGKFLTTVQGYELDATECAKSLAMVLNCLSQEKLLNEKIFRSAHEALSSLKKDLSCQDDELVRVRSEIMSLIKLDLS